MPIYGRISVVATTIFLIGFKHLSPDLLAFEIYLCVWGGVCACVCVCVCRGVREGDCDCSFFYLTLFPTAGVQMAPLFFEDI